MGNRRTFTEALTAVRALARRGRRMIVWFYGGERYRTFSDGFTEMEPRRKEAR